MTGELPLFSSRGEIMISFNCPGCNKTFSLKDELAGRKAKCPQCGTVLVVPNSAHAVARQPGRQPEAPPACCSICGDSLQIGARFCSGCGAPTSRQAGVPLFACPACGRNVSSQAESCPGCGQPTFEYCSAEVREGWNDGPIKGRGQENLDRLLQEGWEVAGKSYDEEEWEDRQGDRCWIGTTTHKLRRSLLKHRGS